MDYGQTKQPIDPQFFTAGVGDLPASQNTYEAENNLDLTNEATSWATRDLRGIGNKAIFSAEDPSDATETINQEAITVDSKESLPEIIDVVAPPTANLESDPAAKIIPFDPKLIRTDGDRISSGTVSEVNHVISKLTQTGKASDFYATIRGDETHPGMVRENLKNSYNREVAA